MLLYSSSDRFLIGTIVIHVSEHFTEKCDKRQHDLAQQQVSVSVHPPYMLVQRLGSIPPEGHWDTSATSPIALSHHFVPSSRWNINSPANPPTRGWSLIMTLEIFIHKVKAFWGQCHRSQFTNTFRTDACFLQTVVVPKKTFAPLNSPTVSMSSVPGATLSVPAATQLSCSPPLLPGLHNLHWDVHNGDGMGWVFEDPHISSGNKQDGTVPLASLSPPSSPSKLLS